MPSIFEVIPEELESSASTLADRIADFIKTYNSIYLSVSDLRVSYKGEASDTFNQRIEGYKNDFAAAEKALNNYIEFLREYASKVRRVENQIRSDASSLQVV